MENEREKEKRFQVYHNHRSSGSDGVVPFPAETGRCGLLTVTHTDGEYRLWVEVNANRWTIENREQFAEKLLKMVDENTFQKVHFSEDLEEPHCIIFRVYLMPYHRTGHLR